jgi:hypothetical protein
MVTAMSAEPFERGELVLTADGVMTHVLRVIGTETVLTEEGSFPKQDLRRLHPEVGDLAMIIGPVVEMEPADGIGGIQLGSDRVLWVPVDDLLVLERTLPCLSERLEAWYQHGKSELAFKLLIAELRKLEENASGGGGDND